jgi:chromosome segregation ATPase
MDSEETKKGNKINKIFYIVVGIITIALIVITYLFLFQKKEMDEIVDNLNEEKMILTEEYQKLLDDYDSLQNNNEMRGFGTINYIELLENEKEKVAHLIEEIKIIKATNTAKIREYQKELSTLRSVLVSYIAQIDSLNTRNEELTKENKEVKRRYTQIETSYKKLEVEKAGLEQKVSIASQLDITNTMAEALNSNNKKIDKAGRASKIRVCFTVLKNVTAPVGMKKFFVRIERPDGQLLMHNREDLFTYEGSQINFSAFREIEYGGDETDVCVFYTVDSGELMKGKYTADIFADGYHIGNISFSLK